MKQLKQLICELSDLAGIIPFYYDCKGNYIEISVETKAQLISAMGISPEESLHWIEYFKNYPDFLEPVYVIKPGFPVEIYLKENLIRKNSSMKEALIEIFPFEELANKGDALCFKVELSPVAEKKYSIPIPFLPIGYYRLRVSLEKTAGETVLIVVPENCFVPYKNKIWGLQCNLWSLKESAEGNFSHLRKLAEYINSIGGFIGINPLHFNDPEDIYGISPYSAISRQFNTPLYLSKCPVQLKNEKIFEYPYVWKEKMECLRKDFEAFYRDYINANAMDFIAYKNKLCPAIRDDLKYFSVFCFLRERFGKDWQSWSPELRHPSKEILNKIYRDNEKEVLFYEYLQWLVDSELDEIKKYPVLLDMGFCSIKSSFDVWINQEIYALKVEYGAPPDDFNPKGQKWGAPPVIPFKLKEKAYLPFIKILRANMKTKLLRIDHALGLFRAFWIPEGSSPDNGAYVKYPWKDLLGIIALESQLNQTGVIGEDLGTAEEWMKNELIKRKICSWRVFYFEKSQERYKSSSIYPEDSLCSITTHDLPTLKGFWNGKDIELRNKFKIYDEKQAHNAFMERQNDIKKIIALLKEENLLERDSLTELFLAILKFLAKTPSKYLLLYPEDILLLEEQINFPGTTTEYPNWQRKLPFAINEIIKLPIFKEIEAILKEAGRVHSFD
ncbi:MAG: 4-alpha-glucanotransferase [Thermodesulfovibrio sp.]